MSFHDFLTDEEAAFRQEMRSFVKNEIVPLAAEIDVYVYGTVQIGELTALGAVRAAPAP